MFRMNFSLNIFRLKTSRSSRNKKQKERKNVKLLSNRFMGTSLFRMCNILRLFPLFEPNIDTKFTRLSKYQQHTNAFARTDTHWRKICDE